MSFRGADVEGVDSGYEKSGTDLVALTIVLRPSPACKTLSLPLGL